MNRIEVFYPFFTKKALTFTMDDGNMKYDRMLLDILEPAGIKGTFNLCSDFHEGRERETREFYRGYEIANHSKYHPLVNLDGVEYVISPDHFDPETADKRLIYKVEGLDGFFWRMQPNGWRQMVFEDDFMRYVADGIKELNEIFGEGLVKDFAWPYGEQNNSCVKEKVKKIHRYVRKTGCTLDRDDFALPKDKKAWSYNADHTNLLGVMEKYEAYPNDGELKFFAFGVHSIDFERDLRWDDLRIFAERYGNRQDTYWYASVGEIFDYEEATLLLEITDSTVTNRSKLTLYLTVDGERISFLPGKTISI